MSLESGSRWQQFNWRALLIATAAIAALLLLVVLTPQVLSREARLQVLRAQVGEMARLAASQVDGDLHRVLIEGPPADAATLAIARAPLLKLHAAWPEAIYLYTMGTRDGEPYFILDTAQDAQFAQQRGLRASRYREAFQLRAEYASNWLQELAAGHTVVNEEFQNDDYGIFLSGHAPIRDRDGAVAGFVGVDFDLDYYRREEQRFRQIELASIGVTLLLAVLLGYVYARYRFSQQAEMQHHFQSSMQDSLTGLLNRRGAQVAIEAGWSDAGVHSHAALLVDIDNFKSINDTLGHATGDAVIHALANALRDCLRPGDTTARLGGDEFVIFAHDCDEEGAEHIAARLLAAVRQNAESPVRFSISIGISVITAADGGFDLLYRQADTALYRAKHEGRDRYALFRGA